MNKRSQFQLSRRDGKIIMRDMENNEYILSAVQSESLGRALIGEAKQLKRTRGLRRLARRSVAQ